MNMIFRLLLFPLTITTITSCNFKKQVPQNNEVIMNTSEKRNVNVPEGMIWVPTKTFLMGAKIEDKFAMMREKPAHKVIVDGFFIDANEVTNQQFQKFVDATKYITVAERPIDWEVIKKDLPRNLKASRFNFTARKFNF